MPFAGLRGGADFCVRLLCALALGCFGVGVSAAEEKPAAIKPVADVVGKEITPLLQKYCVECHSPKKKSGELDLTVYGTELSLLKARTTWTTVQRVLRANEMPPEDKPQPTVAEKEALVKVIDKVLNSVDCSKGIEPGRVTMRRLNRVEYNNTVRDLTGVDLRPADDFPADDSGYGFDHIGDVLSLPPVLFEKYLAATERVMEAALREGEIVNGPVRRYPSREMKVIAGKEAPEKGKYGRLLAVGVEIGSDVESAAEYDYIANVRGLSSNDKDEPKKLELRLDGKPIKVVEFNDMKVKTHPVRLSIPAGRHLVSVKRVGTTKGEMLFEYIDMQGPIDESPTLSEELILVCRPKSDGSDEKACVEKIVQRFVTRAFRRPATADEVAQYATLFQNRRTGGDSYLASLRTALTAVMMSSQFLFRVESDPATIKPEVVRTLNDYELATRLSYFLWSSMPDEELFAVAAKGELHRSDVIKKQVARMLTDPKRRTLVENFTGQWLQLRNLSSIAPDKGAFPNFDDALRTAMRRETELFFENLIQGDRSVLEMLDADYTFVNERLAKHYGIKGIKGAELQKVNFTNDERGGVLTHGSILTVTSNPTRTSPVKRGKWILENILGAAPPPPPPMVNDLDESAEGKAKGSLRQRMEAHRSNPGCASCHQRMDPLGFGLENFDGIGGWRTKDGNFDIEPGGELPGGESFKTPKQMRNVLLKHKDEFTRCVVEKMLTYGLGRGLEYYDKCAVDAIAVSLKQKDYKFSALIEGIVMSDPFQRRRSAKMEP
ncbi:MAG: DUF1592 domain-containing protein [Planctomycetales bacterium]